MISFNIILIILIIIIFYLINNYLINNYLENYENNKIIFYRKNNLYNDLIKDNDNYFKSFSKIDLKVRNINDINQYNKILFNSLCDPDEKLINKIKNCIYKINKITYNYNNKYFNNVDLNKFNKLKWKIGFVCDKNYEYGFPHTRNDIIILNKNFCESNHELKLMKTLVHEQIHIYQKLYPEEVKKYITIHQFKKIKKIDENDNIRANPDLDGFIYQDKNFNTYKALYNKNPTNIGDVTFYPMNTQYYEHPNERMAIEFEYIIEN